MKRSNWAHLGVAGLIIMMSGATAQAQKDPISILPPAPPVEAPKLPVEPVAVPPVVMPETPPVVAPHWTVRDAAALLTFINSVSTLGLIPADYEPAALAPAIVAGEGPVLDEIAGKLFTRVATDLRDGRTPAWARAQWLIKDSDAKTTPILPLMQSGLTARDVAGALSSLEPAHPDYAALKAVLAATPPANVARIKQIRANLDRWRWMPQTLGFKHILANVPEYMARLMVNGKLISAHRVIVGKLDTPTPQVSADAVGVVIHPPWFLPQSIITESVGALIAKSPAVARARGYTWTGSGKTLAVIQQAGPTSALGFIKIDMPNSEAIFLHDTPNRSLFDTTVRAYSHGCLRTEDVMKLAIVLGVIQQGGTADELVTLIKAGKTTKVPFKETIPVYIGYFTIASGADGKLQTFSDIYGRDAPIIASFDKPRGAPAPAPKVIMPVANTNTKAKTPAPLRR
ncbi:MAG: L,D-transpeptidase family protein [Sphingomonadaceae bacterium]